MPQSRTITEPREAVLNDGTRVHFRPIRPDDKENLQAGVARMSAESRYRRFFAPVDHLSDEQLVYFTEVDQRSHVAWIATLPDVPGDPAIAVARFIRMPDDPEAAEAAVTVVDEYQGRGVGRAILLVISEVAISLGVRRFSMYVLGQNDSMLKLLGDTGAVLDTVQEGVYQLHVDLPASIAAIDTSAAPRVLKVAASGRLQGELKGIMGTLFKLGQK